jgi:6-phosphogluconolactonase
LNRRSFMQIAVMTALALRSRRLHAAKINPMERSLAFVGSMEQPQGIHIYNIEHGRWRLLNFVSSEAPISLALHPSSNTLYVLNSVNEYQGLPCGSVEAYKLQAKTGQLTLLGRQPLALSATMPRDLAISPDGKMLAVAVHGGGAYNLLPVFADGRIGRVSSALKIAGRGPIADHQDTAHPQVVLFDRTGKQLLTSDLGCDRLGVFSLDTVNGTTLAEHHRLALPPGSGPRHLLLHPVADRLYVDHALDASLSGFHYDPATGKIGERFISRRGDFGDALAIHPEGTFLYSSGNSGMTAWRIDPETGSIEPIQSLNIRDEAVRAIIAIHDGSAILTLTSKGIMRRDIEAWTGRLYDPVFEAEVPNACSLVIHPCDGTLPEAGHRIKRLNVSNIQAHLLQK